MPWVIVTMHFELNGITVNYKISVGDIEWDGGVFHSVVKVKMMYDGKIAGRKSPSYPIDSDDYIRVCEAIQKLVEECN